MQKITKNEAGYKLLTWLFPTTESVTPIVRLFRLNKTLRGQVLANCNNAKKPRAWEKLFQFLAYDCLFSRLNSHLEESVSQKAKQLNEATRRI